MTEPIGRTLSPYQQLFAELYQRGTHERVRNTRCGALLFLREFGRATDMWLAYLAEIVSVKEGDWNFIAEYLERGYGPTDGTRRFLARVLRGDEKRNRGAPRTNKTRMKHFAFAKAVDAELSHNDSKDAAYRTVAKRLGMDRDNVAKVFAEMKPSVDWVKHTWEPLFELVDEIRARAARPRAAGEYMVSKSALNAHFLS